MKKILCMMIVLSLILSITVFATARAYPCDDCGGRIIYKSIEPGSCSPFSNKTCPNGHKTSQYFCTERE